REEQHDLAGRRDACVDELSHPRGDRLRFALAPEDAAIAEAPLIGDEQLDGMPEDGIVELARRRERLVTVAELVVEELVDRSEDLGARAVVARERQPLRRALAPFAEHGDVGVPE